MIFSRFCIKLPKFYIMEKQSVQNNDYALWSDYRLNIKSTDAKENTQNFFDSNKKRNRSVKRFLHKVVHSVGGGEESRTPL